MTATLNAAPGGELPIPIDRRVLEERERAERRRTARDEMRADHHSAAERISAWERLHGLQLPRDPNHVVLRVVARRTGLRMDAVIEEQRLRAVRQAGTAALTKSTT